MTALLAYPDQKADHPERILTVAFEEFVAKGYEATSLESVEARIAGPKGTVRAYFRDKDQLLETVIREASKPFAAILHFEELDEGTAPQRLKRFMFSLYWTIVLNRETRELLKLIMSEGIRFPAIVDRHRADFIDPMLAHLQDIVDAGVASGEFRNSPASHCMSIIIAPTIYATMWMNSLQDRHDLEIERYIEAHYDLVLHGVSWVRTEYAVQ